MAILRTNLTLLFNTANGAYGSGDASWSDANNAIAYDDTYATATNPDARLPWTSKTLLATVPNLSVVSFPFDVVALYIRVYRHASVSSSILDSNVQLYIDGSLQGNNKASATYWSTSAEGIITYYGDSLSYWGLELNSKNFNSSSGIGISVSGTAGTTSAYIKRIYIQLLVSYFNGIFVP